MTLNIALIAFILIIAIWLAIVEIRAIQHYQNVECGSTIKAIESLKSYQGTENNGLIISSTIGEEAFQWLCRHLNGQVVMGHAFQPYRREDGMFVLISWPSVLSSAVPRGPVYFAPTLLTALGVLGTFGGISLGLQQISPDATADVNSLLASSNQLLGGMKTAFSTSLVGLGTATFFMWFLAAGEKKRQRYRNALRQQISRIAFLETPGHLLGRLDTSSSHKAAEELQRVTESLAGLSTLNAEEIGRQIAIALKPGFVAIRNDLAHQRKTIEAQRQELLQTLVQSLRTDVIEPVVVKLDESARMTQEASSAVRQLKEELGGISSSLASSIQTIETFQKDTLIKLQEFAGDLHQILRQFQLEIQDSVRDSAEQQKAMLQEVRSSTENTLEQANAAFVSQTETLKQVGENASELMSTASTELRSTLENIGSSLQATRITVQEELEEFRVNYQNALNLFFEQQNNLLDTTLGKQREGLEQVVQDLQRVFKEDAQAMGQQVIESMEKIEHTARVVETMANTIGLSSTERIAQLQELTRTIGQEAKQVDQSYRALSDQFDKALHSGNEQLSQYLKEASETYNVRLKDMDSAAVSLCQQLRETSNGLMSVAEYLVSAANDFKGSNGEVAS